MVYIHKSTAIWLFQDTERVSTDIIFRVQSKQPHESDKVNPPHVTQEKTLQSIVHVAEYIVVGDICAFQGSNHSVHLIGRILQFAKYNKGKPFCHKGNYARIENEMAVLCTWYDLKEEKSQIHDDYK